MADYKLRIIVEGEDRASAPLGKASGALNNIFQIAGGNLLARGIESGTRALVGMAGGVNALVTGSADLTAQIDFIGATAGATGAEVDQLGQLIASLGMDEALKVDALGAADAVELLVRNGMSLEDIMAGGARGTVLLANATKADFGVAADIATDAMAQFGIGAEDMGMVANQISGVLSNSKFDINDYALAISQSGGAAASAGLEYDDYNAILATTAYMFNSGSDAGTSLKNFLQALTPGTNAAADKMRALGLYTGLTGDEFEKVQGKISKTNDKISALDPTSKNYQKKLAELNDELAILQSSLVAGNSAFFDQEGQLESGATIADALANAMGNLTEEARAEALETLFGTDASRIAIALLEQRGVKVNELKDAIGNVDSEERARAMMDNLSGDMEIFDGVVDTLKQNVGAELEPTWRVAFQSMTGIVSRFSPQIVGLAGTVAGALTPAIEGWATSISGGLDAAFAAFDAAGGGLAGALAGLGSVSGAVVTVDAEAQITTVDWNADGVPDWTYDANAQVFSLDWNGDGVPDFTYDAKAGIVSVDWFGLMGEATGLYTYNASAGVTTVDWTFGQSGEDGLSYTYEAGAGVTSVDWVSGVTGTKYYYDAGAQVLESSVLWGGWTATYNAKAQIYSKDVLWGAWTYTYDAGARIGGESVLWGAFSYVYDAEANITTVTTPAGTTFQVEGTYSVTDFLFDTSNGPLSDWVWPVLPVWAWPTYAVWKWADYPTFEWPAYSTFTWPSYEAWIWPALPVWAWPTYAAFAWPDYSAWTWPDYKTWTWASYPAFTWPAYVTWAWPAYTKWAWTTYPTWTWPAIPTPGWLSSLLNWKPSLPSFLGGGGGGAGSGTTTDTAPGGAGALGKRRTRGGVTLVGEFGPELVDLPRGARIFSNYESRQMAGAAAGMGGAVINIHATVSGQGDEVRLARRVADILNGRR